MTPPTRIVLQLGALRRIPLGVECLDVTGRAAPIGRLAGAEPPVAKAMDYDQWQYEVKKKQHDARKKQHIILMKELKFRPNTDDHDYDFKKNHAIRFLQEGNRVKAVVQFRGREIAHTDLGQKLLQRFAADIAAFGQMDGQPRMEGRNAHIIISPIKKH